MRNRKWISLAVLLLVLIISAGLITDIYTRIQRKIALQAALHIMPAFQFVALDSSMIILDSIHADQPAVLLFFSPDCEHCQAQAKSVKQYLTILSDIQLFWIADDSINLVRNFALHYGINQLPNTKVVTIPSGQMKYTFGITQLPTALIYDRQRHLIRQFRGETKWEAIFAALNSDLKK